MGDLFITKTISGKALMTRYNQSNINDAIYDHPQITFMKITNFYAVF